jgi:hypothetical protein
MTESKNRQWMRRCPEDIFLANSKSLILRPMRFTARVSRISSQLMEAGFSCAAEIRNHSMALCRNAASLS